MVSELTINIFMKNNYILFRNCVQNCSFLQRERLIFNNKMFYILLVYLLIENKLHFNDFILIINKIQDTVIF